MPECPNSWCDHRGEKQSICPEVLLTFYSKLQELLSCNINPTKQRNRFTQPYSNICINKNCKPLLPRVIFTSQLFNYPHEVLTEHSRLLSSKSILKLSTLPLSFPVTFNYFPSKAGTLQLIPKSCYYSVKTAVNRHISKSLAGVREFRLGNYLFKYTLKVMLPCIVFEMQWLYMCYINIFTYKRQKLLPAFR